MTAVLIGAAPFLVVVLAAAAALALATDRRIDREARTLKGPQ